MNAPENPTLSVDGESSAHPYLNKEHGKIRGLFDAIAPRYDLLNHLLSFNLDRVWRRIAIRELPLGPDRRFLDACSGTGDLSFEIVRALRRGGHTDSSVCSTDFSIPMLEIGSKKRPENGLAHTFIAADTLHLPFRDHTFEGATVSFGIRNVEDLSGGLEELRRVLRPGGKLVLLEFTPVRTPGLKQCFDLYCHGILPRIGNLISGSPDQAYSYLQQSIDRWPDGEELKNRMREAGFKAVRWRRLIPGNVALHVGTA